MNIKKNILSLLLLFSFIMTAQNEYYELRTYIIPYNAAEKNLHNYLSKSLLPFSLIINRLLLKAL